MEKSEKTIIVPWGLTTFSEYAFMHAVPISKALGHTISIVRVVKTENLKKEAERDLAEVAEELSKKYGIKPGIIVEEGNVTTRIGEIAEQLESKLIVKHTVPATGMEKLLGSKSIKIIAGSQVPFIVVQKPPTAGTFERIVCPIDQSRESKEKLNWITFMYKNFKSKFYIITPRLTDESEIRFMNGNLRFCKTFLEERGVDIEVYPVESKEDFAKEMLKYATKVNADLLMIMLPKNLNTFLNTKEQDIITNSSGIPVMCINPRKDLMKAGGFS